MSSGAALIFDAPCALLPGALAVVFVAVGVSCQNGIGLSSHVPETSVSGTALRSSACSRLPCVELAVLSRSSTLCEQSILFHIAAAAFGAAVFGAAVFGAGRFLPCG